MTAIDSPHQDVYFIGITLPDELEHTFADLQWHLCSDNAHALKPVVPHITLLHPPTLAGIMPSELLPRIHDVAERYLPISIQLNRIGFFGDQVCYLEAESFKLYSLQARLVRMLPLDVQTDHYKRPYLPHITLTQVYDPTKLDKVAMKTRISESLPLPIRYTIDSVACFTRILPRVYQSKAVI
jgi:2'-5' RNA ligase